MARNPYYDAAPASGRGEGLRHLVRLVATHLQARASEATIPDAELRALHPLLANARIWERVVAALEGPPP